jgi:hypothetical protein
VSGVLEGGILLCHWHGNWVATAADSMYWTDCLVICGPQVTKVSQIASLVQFTSVCRNAGVVSLLHPVSIQSRYVPLCLIIKNSVPISQKTLPFHYRKRLVQAVERVSLLKAANKSSWETLCQFVLNAEE